MAQHNEVEFEKELCQHLASNGWLYSPTDAGYDKVRALFPDDVFGWLEDTQPKELAKTVKPTDSPALQAKARDQLLDRLVKVLDLPLSSQGGTLRALRKGFQHGSASLKMAQFRPADNLNPVTLGMYGKVRLRVMRQVHYSKSNKNSIDLVFFVNGLPVATAELKTDFTQSIQHAIRQYQEDRRPAGEPLLKFGARALVHLAVSNSEVWMCTDLRPDKPKFRPLNKGNDGHAGNPENPNGSPSSYLWEELLQRDNWLAILGKFMLVTTDNRTDLITGKTTTTHGVLFPRYHQWDAVTRLVEAAKADGPGSKYLIQHSAGSGKTNSIAWTAQRLSTLHTDDGKRVFDSVIVVTDRNVLDAQLKAALFQIEAQPGVVVAIGTEGGKAKSSELTAALLSAAAIIIVTIQTFPFAVTAMADNKALAGKSFAVIADEAHSSQTGNTANKLKEILSPAELEDLKDGGEVSADDVLVAVMADRAAAKNISYFAFTATPKGKTLELFGTPNTAGLPEPFHLYSMQQAIEENYILDVLQNYLPYKIAWKLAHNGVDYKSDELVDQSKAVKGLVQWVRLHEHSIAQKTGIIIEHFRENIAHLLTGSAKAMVVTGSRKEAVRYKIAFDKYLAKKGYTGIAAMVAFSGEVLDPESNLLDPEKPFTETNMNPGLKGRSLARAFDTDEYNVLLVANKFQTGFDQPLLVAMYVDKKLSGVTAVQTLSRLNRTFPGKSNTYILDFVNDPDDILAAFKPYYRQATLAGPSDANIIHDLRDKLDSAQIYTDSEVDGLANAYVHAEGNNALMKWINPAKSRFLVQINQATADANGPELEALKLFRNDLGAYVRAYDFLSQIIDYGDPALEKRALFYRLLSRVIVDQTGAIGIDLSAVEMTYFKAHKQEHAQLALGGDADQLQPMTAAGAGAARDPKMARLAEIVTQLNTLFDDVSFSDVDRVAIYNHILGKMAENESLQEQARANNENQFSDSPDVGKAFLAAVVDAMTNHSTMSEKLLENEHLASEFVTLLLPDLYRRLNDEAA